MSEILEKQILVRLENVEKKMDALFELMDDRSLSDDDKLAVRTALKEEKEGKLLSKKLVFG